MNGTSDYAEVLLEIKSRAATLGITTMLLNKANVARILDVPAQHLGRCVVFPKGEKYVTPQWLARQLHREDTM